MKYYSEVLEKAFDTVEELEKAEKEKKQLDAEAETKKNEISKAKKLAAEAVQSAEKEVDDAQENLKEVRAQARELLKEAYNKLSIAQEHRFNALKKFTEDYGPYKTYYTGEKAYNEFQKALSYFDNMFNWWL